MNKIKLEKGMSMNFNFLIFLLSLSLITISCARQSLNRTPSQVKREVIYGKDDRKNTSKIKDNFILKLARSTAGMVKKRSIKDYRNRPINQSGDVGARQTLESYNTFSNAHNLCKGERFGEEPTSPSCSGFLVAPDILITAGHCVEQDLGKRQRDCDSKSWVFDLNLSSFKPYSNGHIAPLKKNQVYNCQRILKTGLEHCPNWKEKESNYETQKRRECYQNGPLDYAVIQLDRPVQGRESLEIRKSGKIEFRDSVMVIGHPSGLPAKVTTSGKIFLNDVKNSFQAFIDTYGGNSGSPVFREVDGQIEGILVSGATDFVEKGGCYKSNHCPEKRGYKGCGGERIIRITSVPGLQQIISKSNQRHGSEPSTNPSLSDSRLGKPLPKNPILHFANGSQDIKTLIKGRRAATMFFKATESVGSNFNKRLKNETSIKYKIIKNSCRSAFRFRTKSRNGSFLVDAGMISRYIHLKSCHFEILAKGTKGSSGKKKVKLIFKDNY